MESNRREDRERVLGDLPPASLNAALILQYRTQSRAAYLDPGRYAATGGDGAILIVCEGWYGRALCLQGDEREPLVGTAEQKSAQIPAQAIQERRLYRSIPIVMIEIGCTESFTPNDLMEREETEGRRIYSRDQ